MKIIELFESFIQWPKILRSAKEISDYISSQSSNYVDKEVIEEYFSGCQAVLEELPLESIREGNPEANIRDKRKERKYTKLDIATMPPIVVENGIIQDGNHRFRVAKAKGLNKILCYVVKEEEI